MHRIAVAVFAALLLTCHGNVATAQIGNTIVGVNQVGLAGVSKEQQESILTDMARAGVRWLRVPLHKPLPATLSAIRIAQDKEIGILLNISLNLSEFYEPGTPMRSGYKRVENAYPISQISVDRFRDVISTFWLDLERQRLKLLAVELGNEINWTFNGDLAVYQGQPGRTLNAGNVREFAAFKAGLNKYVELASVISNVRARSTVNKGTIILSAGLAQVRSAFVNHIGAEFVDASLTINILEQRQLFRWVDGYAIHYYPQPGSTGQQIENDVKRTMHNCRPPTEKPCWITEWGVTNSSSSCPIDDRDREGLVRKTRAAFARESQKSLAGFFYFEWKGIGARSQPAKSPRSIWRCDHLSSSGKAALAQ